jgi:hypothetical protein
MKRASTATTEQLKTLRHDHGFWPPRRAPPQPPHFRGPPGPWIGPRLGASASAPRGRALRKRCFLPSATRGPSPESVKVYPKFTRAGTRPV